MVPELLEVSELEETNLRNTKRMENFFYLQFTNHILHISIYN